MIVGVDAMFRFKGSTLSFLLFAASVGFQIITLLMLARLLGAAEFGWYSLYIALITIFVELSALGTGELLIVHVAREHTSLRIWLSHALFLGMAAGVVLAAVLTPIVAYVIPFSLSTVVFFILVLTEIVFGRACILVEQVYIALARTSYANAVRAFVNATRLVSLVILILIHDGVDLSDWLPLQAVAVGLSGTASIAGAVVLAGTLTFSIRSEAIPEGMMLGTNSVLRMVQQNSDRIILSVVLAPTALGQYAAASRIVMVSLTPIQAFLRTKVAGYHQREWARAGGALQYALEVIKKCIPVSIISIFLCWVGLYATGYVLGEEYLSAFHIGFALSPILFSTSLIYILGDTMAALRQARSRMLVSACFAVLSAVLIYVGGEMLGIYGAVIGMLLGSVLHAASLAYVVIRRASSR